MARHHLRTSVLLVGVVVCLITQETGACPLGFHATTPGGVCLPCSGIDERHDDPAWLIVAADCSQRGAESPADWYSSYFVSQSATEQVTFAYRRSMVWREVSIGGWPPASVPALMFTTHILGDIVACETVLAPSGIHFSSPDAKVSPNQCFLDWKVVDQGMCTRTATRFKLRKFSDCLNVVIGNYSIVAFGDVPTAVFITDGVIVALALASGTFAAGVWVMGTVWQPVLLPRLQWILLAIMLIAAAPIHVALLGTIGVLGSFALLLMLFLPSGTRHRYKKQWTAVMMLQLSPIKAIQCCYHKACSAAHVQEGSLEASPMQQDLDSQLAHMPKLAAGTTIMRIILYLLGAFQGVQLSLNPDVWSTARNFGVLQTLSDLSPYLAQPLSLVAFSAEDYFELARWVVAGAFALHALVLASSSCLPQSVVLMVDGIMASPFILVNAMALKLFSPLAGGDASAPQLSLLAALAVSIGARAFFHPGKADDNDPLGLTLAATALCTFQTLAVTYAKIVSMDDVRVYVIACAISALLRINAAYCTKSRITDLLWNYLAACGMATSWCALIVITLPDTIIVMEPLLIALWGVLTVLLLVLVFRKPAASTRPPLNKGHQTLELVVHQ